jgi:hypothetical protein
MSLLQFMPWCAIDRTYCTGAIDLIPFDRDKKQDDLDELTFCHVKTIMSSYRNLEGHPVKHTTLIKYGDKPLFADLNEEEIEITRECVDIACFVGLSNRDYFTQVGPYCNADSFVLYGQKFKDNPCFIAVTSRRREGRTLDGRPLSDTIFSVPPHASTAREVKLDETFLLALFSQRESSTEVEWVRWQNAIACFNQANTDSETVRYQVEWVLLCSAFEHILGVKSKEKDVAAKFAQTLVPSSTLSVSNSKRKSAKMHDPDSPIRYEWIKEFYRVRGDFAHGKLRTVQEMAWQPLEHVVLATIAFPILVRILLSTAGNYKLTDHDRAATDAFEKFANEDFLKPPPDRENSMESWLHRLIAEAKWNHAKMQLAKNLAENRARTRHD